MVCIRPLHASQSPHRQQYPRVEAGRMLLHHIQHRLQRRCPNHLWRQPTEKSADKALSAVQLQDDGNHRLVTLRYAPLAVWEGSLRRCPAHGCEGPHLQGRDCHARGQRPRSPTQGEGTPCAKLAVWHPHHCDAAEQLKDGLREPLPP
jgi:hypothetical protein